MFQYNQHSGIRRLQFVHSGTGGGGDLAHRVDFNTCIMICHFLIFFIGISFVLRLGLCFCVFVIWFLSCFSVGCSCLLLLSFLFLFLFFSLQFQIIWFLISTFMHLLQNCLRFTTIPQIDITAPLQAKCTSGRNPTNVLPTNFGFLIKGGITALFGRFLLWKGYFLIWKD